MGFVLGIPRHQECVLERQQMLQCHYLTAIVVQAKVSGTSPKLSCKQATDCGHAQTKRHEEVKTSAHAVSKAPILPHRAVVLRKNLCDWLLSDEAPSATNGNLP